MGFEQLAALKAQLDQGADRKEVASRLTSPTVDATREIKQPPKRSRTSADAAACAVTALQRHFPRAFPHRPAPKVPLKVGILKDVLARAASLGLSQRDARNGVKLWCRGQRYWTCLVEGDMRVDLTGAISGVVTAVEADYGKNQEKTRLARRREQIAKNRQDQPR
ncbi:MULTISPECIES: ProQ/FinO family protein [unclassified Caballeronia]|uniref:ProQ/FinO family protein n=1 Tax=unclassified Caballeronia TaxID=2646786 RepID=UPI002027ED9E|nr:MULTISPECIES: ProQ/FinO family protein [unclassified Caballeronia]MDR5769909.1 ProQ/FinO family protein [Caballeronia sp. LZ028]